MFKSGNLFSEMEEFVSRAIFRLAVFIARKLKLKYVRR